MSQALFPFFGLILGLLVFGIPPAHAATTNTATFTWDTQTIGNLELRLWATRCMTNTGNQDLNITVYRRPQNTVSTTSTVTGTFYKPQGGTDSISFTGQGDGNYLNTYTFSQTGTYKLVLRATDMNYTAGDLNEYVYVQSFDFNISFTNNNFSVTAGNTGTVQNRVINSDGNRVTGLIGNIDINYPDGALFINDGNISETGNGDYYYPFTAPNTNGTFFAASSFTCGPNTDTNNQGRFTVSGATTGGGSGAGSGGGSGGGGGGSGSGGSGGGGAAKPYSAKIEEWSFLQPLEVGEPNQIKLKIKNTGYLGSAFLIIATITQVQKNEFIATEITPHMDPGETREIYLDETFTAFTSGSRILHIEIYKPDGESKVGEYSKAFDIGGLLRYDIVATCLETSVLPGKEASALFNLINLGDYFQDMQFSWWAEDQNESKIGLGTFPIALYNQESRSLVRSVTIPENAKPGEYTFRAQLAYKEEIIGGSCSFSVRTTKEYYEEQLSYARTVLNELEQLASKKMDSLSAETIEKLSELKILLSLLKNAIQNENYAHAEELNIQIRELLSELSTRIIEEEPRGLLERIDLEQAAIFVVAVLIVGGGMIAIHSLGAGETAILTRKVTSNVPEKDYLYELLQKHTEGTTPHTRQAEKLPPHKWAFQPPAPPSAPLHQSEQTSLFTEPTQSPSSAWPQEPSPTTPRTPPPAPQEGARSSLLSRLKSDVFEGIEKETNLLHRVLGFGKPKL